MAWNSSWLALLSFSQKYLKNIFYRKSTFDISDSNYFFNSFNSWIIKNSLVIYKKYVNASQILFLSSL